MTADEILSRLATDQAGNTRPVPSNGTVVTFGSIEVLSDEEECTIVVQNENDSG